MTILKKIIPITLSLLLVLSFGAFAFADEVDSQTAAPITSGQSSGDGVVVGGSNSSGTSNTAGHSRSGGQTLVDVSDLPMTPGAVDGALTTDELGERIETKGMQIINLMKKIGRAICVISFICCCILAAVSVFSKGPFLFKGLIGALIAGVAYAAITYGEVIVQYIAQFAAT